jgi:hypothetical protein
MKEKGASHTRYGLKIVLILVFFHHRDAEKHRFDRMTE